jgi:multidrug resistance protein MdtO
VSHDDVISAVQWEDRLLKFLRVELAPAPGRARAAARIVVACVVATAIVMTLHSPHASFVIITIFIVSQTNAGASITKALWRVLGTIVGAAVGMVAYVSFLDHPWLRVALLGPVTAFFLFLSQTTTTPYFGLLGGITAILIMTVTGPDAESGIHVGLWRFAMILLGALIGTAAQIFLWPDDPEKLLNAALTERLAAVEDLLVALRDGRPPETTRLDTLVLTGLSRQLDLLDNAEARYPSLRQFHAEQITLIGGVEKLLTTAVAFARSAHIRGAVPSPPARERLAAIIANCARLRRNLQSESPPAEPFLAPAEAPSDATVAASGAAPLLPALIDLEHTLASLPGAMRRGEGGQSPQPAPPAILALDSPSRASFFTPAFSALNTSAILFSLQAGLAATMAYVLYEGMAWPGLATSVWTALLVSQSTLGASVQKALLRLVGASLGGLLGLVTILMLVPNIDSLTPLLIVVAGVTSIAAWLAAGSARIAYVGIQIGLAFALCFQNDLGPTTDLVPARDRVLGVLLGIGVWAFVFGLTGSVIAGRAMRRSLAIALRSLAVLSRVGLRGDATAATLRPARGWRWKVYQDLTTTLRLHDESKFEWGAGLADAEAERAVIGRLAADAQAVFLALLALIHHRLNADLSSLAPALRAKFQALAQGVLLRLEALANRIQGKEETASPDLPMLFAQVEAATREAIPSLEPQLAAWLPGRLALYEDLIARIADLDRDAISPRAKESARLPHGAAVAGA